MELYAKIRAFLRRMLYPEVQYLPYSKYVIKNYRDKHLPVHVRR